MKNHQHLDAGRKPPRQVKQHAFNDLAGCVTQRRSRVTGTVVGVYRNDQAGMNCDCVEPWSTVCENHGHLVTHDTLKLALFHAGDPAGWCEACAAIAATEAR